MGTGLSLKRVRLAVSGSFFVSGAIVASWIPHIPLVQHHLALSPALLGFVLFAAAIGAVAAMFIAGKVSSVIGTARLMRLATTLYACMLPLTVLAPNAWVLALVLGLMGLGNGALAVGMNAEAIEVERAYGTGIMSSFHALYSLGCLAGASVGGLVIASGISPVVHLVMVALLLGVFGSMASYGYLPYQPAETAEPTPFLIKPTPYLTMLGLGALCSFVSEGAIADWAAIYMRDTLSARAALTATGYAAFSLMMVLGRLSGDASTRALGPSGMVRLGGCVATFGMAVALLIRHPLGAIIGFGLVGAGLANVVPNFFTAAGREPSMPSAQSVACVSSFGFAGYLAGPPIIGAIAQTTSMPVALGSIGFLTAAIALLAGVLKRRPKATELAS